MELLRDTSAAGPSLANTSAYRPNLRYEVEAGQQRGREATVAGTTA